MVYGVIVVDSGSAELCYSHPGGEADVFVTARSLAFGRLCGRPVYPYHGTADEVVEALMRFILRGIGLRESAIAALFDPAMLRRPNMTAAA